MQVGWEGGGVHVANFLVLQRYLNHSYLSVKLCTLHILFSCACFCFVLMDGSPRGHTSITSLSALPNYPNFALQKQHIFLWLVFYDLFMTCLWLVLAGHIQVRISTICARIYNDTLIKLMYACMPFNIFTKSFVSIYSLFDHSQFKYTQTRANQMCPHSI